MVFSPYLSQFWNTMETILNSGCNGTIQKYIFVIGLNLEAIVSILSFLCVLFFQIHHAQISFNVTTFML